MFLAHRSELKKNEFKPLQQFDKKCVLVNSDVPVVQSNVCPHQKSLISLSTGSGTRVCPFHGLAFDVNGRMIETSRSKKLCPHNNNLTNSDVFVWKDLFFTKNISLKELDFVDFSNFVLEEQRVDRVNSNYKNIMDLFLDVDHIPLVHSGLYQQIGFSDADTVDWFFYDFGSLQLVKNNTPNLEFNNTLLPTDANNPYGAAWLSVYPGTMIEWQPGALFITVATPSVNNYSDVHVFKYRDTRYNDKNWMINSEVWETAWSQDKTQSELIAEFNQDNLEEYKKHFRNWLNDHCME